MINKEVIKAVVVGHAVADALGVPVEFESREQLKKHPVEKMEGYGTYPVPAGSWSDDTSMTLGALDSLANGHIDFDEVMDNFGKWYYENEYTPTGKLFDVGNTCARAIENYYIRKMTFDECGLSGDNSNGNGSLMRIHPHCLFLIMKNYEDGEALKIIDVASALTHAHKRSKFACEIYYFILKEILNKPEKNSIITGLKIAREKIDWTEEEYEIYNSRLFMKIAMLDDDSCVPLEESEIKSGGYVIDTIEGAIWCLLNTSSYEECVLKAVNLGADTDTVAAIAGGLAGAIYGYSSIPKTWLEVLKKREYIEEICERFFENNK